MYCQFNNIVDVVVVDSEVAVMDSSIEFHSSSVVRIWVVSSSEVVMIDNGQMGHEDHPNIQDISVDDQRINHLVEVVGTDHQPVHAVLAFSSVVQVPSLVDRGAAFHNQNGNEAFVVASFPWDQGPVDRGEVGEHLSRMWTLTLDSSFEREVSLDRS